MQRNMAGHLLVQCLIEQGVDCVFGVPGESFLDVLDGFHAQRERIRFIACRHEGGAAFMAEAQGKLGQTPGVCIVTRGPGAANAAIGLHMAFQDSTPMVLLVGDVGGDFRDREAFQELDFAAMFGPNSKGLAKRVERIDDPERIPEYVQRAFATALCARPGPVVLVLPEDMLSRPVAARPAPRARAPRGSVAHRDLQALRELLRAARRPLLIAGGRWTASGARALQRFAEAWSLPACNAFRFQDAFDNHHPLYAGDVGIAINPRLAQRVRDSDLVLAVGARLGEMTTSGYTLLESPCPRQRLVHVHAGAEELHRVYRADLAIACGNDDAAEAFAQIEPPPDAVPWQAWADAAHADYRAHVAAAAPAAAGLAPGADASEPIDMPSLVGTLQRMLPQDAVITNGAGNFASWVHRYFRFHGIARGGGKTQLAPTGGAMGYGVPAGIAANLLSGRVAFTVAGDGDFQMNGQELATAVQHGARSIILLLDNGMYGTIRMHQERRYPERVSGTELRNPDFRALALAYGYAAEAIDRTADFEPALRRALTRDTGTLLLVKLSPQILTTTATLEQIRRQGLCRLAAPDAPSA